MAKIQPAVLVEAITTVLQGTKDKKRPFNESIELHVNLKNYDTQKDKRFSGAIALPHIARPRMSVCLIGDAYHLDQAAKHGITCQSIDDLKKLNKNKKLVKKMCAGHDAFIASDSLIRTVPRLVGPHMNRAGKFPTPVSQGEDLNAKITDIQSTIRFQLKKVLCLGIVVGHAEMEAESIRQNIMKSINFLVTLLKKNWQNVKSLYIKSTFGKVQKVY
ncbi:60S ribosomal protein L10a [Diplonema papillatum]|nr:60S ribosomal protein L10a [Diplonema papillatum]KAJ9441466.1 60S ribosomal protein L10a [Diplonema papillatum]